MNPIVLREYLSQLDSQELVERKYSSQMANYTMGGSWSFKSGRGSVSAIVGLKTRLRRQDDPSKWVQTFFIEGEIAVGSVESGGYDQRINFCFLTWDDANSSESKFKNSYNIPKNVYISLEQISYNTPAYQDIPYLTIEDRDVIARFLEKIARMFLDGTAKYLAPESKVSGHFINNLRNPRADIVQFHQKLWNISNSFDPNMVSNSAREGFTFEIHLDGIYRNAMEIRKWPDVKVLSLPLFDREDPNFERITTWIYDDKFEFEYQWGDRITFDPPVILDGLPLKKITVYYIVDPSSPIFVSRTPFYDGPITGVVNERAKLALRYSMEGLTAYQNSRSIELDPNSRTFFIAI